jgi:hypothetical protein
MQERTVVVAVEKAAWQHVDEKGVATKRKVIWHGSVWAKQQSSRTLILIHDSIYQTDPVVAAGTPLVKNGAHGAMQTSWNIRKMNSFVDYDFWFAPQSQYHGSSKIFQDPFAALAVVVVKGAERVDTVLGAPEELDSM